MTRKWTEIDDTASELELHILLEGFVRMLKPELVVETGTYKGHATLAIGQALYGNGFGKLVTCDVNPEFIASARKQIEPYGYPIEFRQCSSLDLPELEAADFVFSDSDYSIRRWEVTKTKPGCVILIHDTTDESHQKYGGKEPHLGDYITAMGGLLFNAGRGFGIIVKR